MSNPSTYHPLSFGDLLALKRWNTPTIYNGWEQITQRDPAREGFNLEETKDFMPHQGSMVGYAITVVIQPGHHPSDPKIISESWKNYRHYVASIPGPKVVVVQDLDKPQCFGAMWGEVNATLHRAQGCVGTITDGGIRDLEEMTDLGFKALARRLCVGHAHAHPLRWDCPIQAFGCEVLPGDLIHADPHGFMALRPNEWAGLVEATNFLDAMECNTFLSVGRQSVGLSPENLLHRIDQAAEQFQQGISTRFRKATEWGQ